MWLIEKEKSCQEIYSSSVEDTPFEAEGKFAILCEKEFEAIVYIYAVEYGICILPEMIFVHPSLHFKKRLARESLVSDIPAGDRKIANDFYSVKGRFYPL